MSEATIFRSATLVALLHGLDDAFVSRQPGVELGAHAVAAVVAVAAAGAAIGGFGRLRPGLRAALALAFGVLALVHGVIHGAHVALDGLGRGDLTGLLALPAGAVLLGLGIAIPVRHPAGARRWRNRAVAAVGGAIAAYALVMPMALAITQTHKFREPIGAPPSAAYQAVTFDSADGLEIAGWYVPSKNRAAVILVHGGGGDRTGSVAHARLLARHGYGVLLYDARGRGESEGSHNAYGWGWKHDVAGAMAFLEARPEVDGDRIGGLGLSTGADVLLEVAAERKDLRAVVSDGATAHDTSDVDFGPATAQFWVVFAGIHAISPATPGPPIEEVAARVAPTPLLLISSKRFPGESDFNERYARAAGEPSEWWDADAGHTDAIRDRAAEYERRVVGLFDRALR